MGGQGLDGGDKVMTGDPPVPTTRENPVYMCIIENFSLKVLDYTVNIG